MKVLITMAGALAVLAFAAGAWAQDEDVLDADHVDDPENGKYVFWDLDEMNEFIAEHLGQAETAWEGGGEPDSSACAPPASAISTYHTGREPHWHLDTGIYYKMEGGIFVSYACAGAHMYSGVYGIQVTWKVPSWMDCWDYCDWDDWTAKYRTASSTWSPMTDLQSCSYDFYGSTYYVGRELDGITNRNYTGGSYMALFDRYGTNTDSIVKVETCVE